jgi:hypothetical protein
LVAVKISQSVGGYCSRRRNNAEPRLAVGVPRATPPLDFALLSIGGK